jgi:heme o synthase
MTATEPAVTSLRMMKCARQSTFFSQAADYWLLTKPDVNLLIAVTTLFSFWLALPDRTDCCRLMRLIGTLLGTLLVAAGAGTLNQYIERSLDARMRRTGRRPLAIGRVAPSSALCFGVLLACAGVICLATAVNALASFLATLTLLGYLLVYTPLKRKTPLCTPVGALFGAMPPLIGWAGACGQVSPGAWILYGIVFL